MWLSVERTTARRVAIKSALIFAGGSGCWERGCRGQCARVKSMSLSRVERRCAAAIPSISPAGASGGHVSGADSAALTVTQHCFTPDLAENIRRGDASYLALLDAADAWVGPQRYGPARKSLRPRIYARSACVTDPLLSLNLAEAGIGTIIWATGYTTDYRWLKVNAFDDAQRPQHHRGVSTEPGVYFPRLAVARGAGPPLSGASGTMPNILPTRSPFSASTSVTSRPVNRFP